MEKQKHRVFKPNENITTCTVDNFVPLVVPVLSSSSSSSSASTSRTNGQSSSSSESEKSSDPVTTPSDKPACGGSMQTDPESRPRETVVHRTNTRWTSRIQCKAFLTGYSPSHSFKRESSDSEGAATVGTNRKHIIHTHFSERPKLRPMLEDQNCEGSLQKTQ